MWVIDIKDIKDALLGDGYNPGFKQRIEKVEKETDKNTSQLSKLKSYGTAIVSFLGLVGVVFGILAKTGVI